MNFETRWVVIAPNTLRKIVAPMDGLRPDWGKASELEIAFDRTLSVVDVLRALRTQGAIASNAEWATVREVVAKYRYDAKVREWEDTQSKEIQEWAFGVVASWGLDCVDNVRVANVRKKSQMRRFVRQRKDGCCGTEEVKLLGPDGQTYIIGCNYGH